MGIYVFFVASRPRFSGSAEWPFYAKEKPGGCFPPVPKEKLTVFPEKIIMAKTVMTGGGIGDPAGNKEEKTMNYEKIKAAMDACRQKTGALMGLGFYDLESGKSYVLDGDLALPTASIFKLWLFAALLHMAEEGKISLDEVWTYEEADYVAGSGILIRLEPGTTSMTLRSFSNLMMMYSDNIATDKILRRVGLDTVKAYMQEHGFRDTVIELGCGCVALFQKTPNLKEEGNYRKPSYRESDFFLADCPQRTTVAELIRYFRMLSDGKLLGPEMTEYAISILKKCQTNGRIPALLPNYVKVAHKTGSLDRVANDAGIVFTDNGRYILAMLYNGNMAPYEEYLADYKHLFAEPMLAKLSLEIYEAYMEP